MNYRNFPKNYSQSDIRKLMHQGQRKADYINRILDTDVHINMASECNSPLEEKPKYLRNRFKLNNNKNNFNEKNIGYERYERYDNNMNNIERGQNYLDKSYKEYFNNNYKKRNNEYNFNYNYNVNENNNDLNNSLNLNKPFHRERRHFPLVNNKGNFFKNITPFLVGNTERLKLIRSQNIDNDRYNRINNIPSIYRPNENNIKRYPVEKLRRSSSMEQMPINHSFNNNNSNNSFIVNKNNMDEYDVNNSYSIGNDLSRKYKFYNPYRYDYEGSRYGDNTYNYYLNAPMRSDISADWKFPPLYYYNYNSINEKKKNYSNY